jgi:hypothetical protein
MLLLLLRLLSSFAFLAAIVFDPERREGKAFVAITLRGPHARCHALSDSRPTAGTTTGELLGDSFLTAPKHVTRRGAAPGGALARPDGTPVKTPGSFRAVSGK